MKPNSAIRKIITMAGILISAAVLILSALELFNVWDGAIHLAVPLLGLMQLGEAYTAWNRSRKLAYFHLVTAGFILACSIVVFFVK